MAANPFRLGLPYPTAWEPGTVAALGHLPNWLDWPRIGQRRARMLSTNKGSGGAAIIQNKTLPLQSYKNIKNKIKLKE
jgi:hypothetical protein